MDAPEMGKLGKNWGKRRSHRRYGATFLAALALGVLNRQRIRNIYGLPHKTPLSLELLGTLGLSKDHQESGIHKFAMDCIWAVMIYPRIVMTNIMISPLP